MMSLNSVPLVGLRVSLGAYFFYAGVSKIMNPAWTAEGYLKGAQTFPALYEWFTRPDILPVINMLNEWGLTLVGASLILGALTRVGAIAGIAIMALYYFPALKFPYAGTHAYIVDDHIIFIFAFALLAALNAGRVWGLDKTLSKRKGILSRFA
ncbi:MAG: DoxX family membrane protein [Candidatus Spechtbacterales bacterium]